MTDEIEALVGDFLTTTEIVALAKKALPEPAWDFINGGAETEATLLRNARRSTASRSGPVCCAT